MHSTFQPPLSPSTSPLKQKISSLSINICMHLSLIIEVLKNSCLFNVHFKDCDIVKAWSMLVFSTSYPLPHTPPPPLY